MKAQLILASVLFAGTTAAQTGLIAHKSHSGSATTYIAADPGNFGNPPPRVVKVVWLNDTTVIVEKNEWQSGPDNEKDTIYNHPVFSDPNLSVDTLKGMYYDAVEFENFDKKEIRTPAKPVVKEVNTKPSKTAPETEKSKKAARSKKKKEGNLFWLWIIGGGTFTGVLLFTRKRKPGIAHA